ncbi:ribonuclease Z [Candidatus Micrarchaeota archaeon]|nr:ribonuclease Z [Candidatus Micrarchaeota archaeon]
MIRLVCLGSSAATPTPRSLPSHYAVKYGGVFLFDCAEGCQRQMMKYNVPYGSLEAVFLTHLHADHVLGLPGIVQTLNLAERNEALQVFGPEGTALFVETLFSIPSLRSGFPIKVKEIQQKKTKALSTKLFDVHAFPAEHGCRALGYVLEEKQKIKFHEAKAKGMGIRGRLFTEIQEKGKVEVEGKTIKLEEVTFEEKGKKIVFSGDTIACASTLRAAKDADVLVHDSSFSSEQKARAEETKHCTALEAAELAKKAGAKKLILTHFGNRYDQRKVLLEEAKSVFKESELAEEGREWMV